MVHAFSATVIATIPPPPFQNIPIGSATLHGYGLIMGLAIIGAMFITERGLKLQGVNPAPFQAVALWAVLAGFVGARLYHVATSWRRYLEAPGDIIKIWNGGLGIYGAVLGGAIVGLWLAPRRGIARAALCDAIAPALLFAQALGRWGNYLNQELYGGPTSVPWKLRVEPAFRPESSPEQAYYHPTFLYESLCTATLAIVFYLLLRRWKTRAPGVLFPLYLGAYSCVRVFTETLRVDETNLWFGLRQNLVIAALIALTSFAVAAAMQLRHRRRITARAHVRS